MPQTDRGIRSFCSHFLSHSNIDSQTWHYRIGRGLKMPSPNRNPKVQQGPGPVVRQPWRLESPNLSRCLLYPTCSLIHVKGKPYRTQVARMAGFAMLPENSDHRETERSWVQTLRPLLCSSGARKGSKGTFCQIKETKTNWERAWFCFQTFRYIFYKPWRQYKTFADRAPGQLAALGHGDGTLDLSPKRKQFWKRFSQVGHRSTWHNTILHLAAWPKDFYVF